MNLLYGGTFDPPHLGHLDLVLELRESLKPKKIIILPSGIPAQKSPLFSIEDRYALCNMLFPVRDADIEISRLEMDRKDRAFTYDTLIELNLAPEALTFVVGIEQALAFKHWHRFPDFLPLCKWLIVDRNVPPPPGRVDFYGRQKQLFELVPELGIMKNSGLLDFFSTKARVVSSTQIRDIIRKKMPIPAELEPPAIQAFIQQRFYDIRIRT